MAPGPLAWLALAAAAHPLGDHAAGQSTVLTVHRDRVEVDYYADVPELLVRTARPGTTDPDQLLAAMATELASGLALEVDGAPVPLQTRLRSPPPRPTSEHTIGFALHLEAPLDPGPHGIEVVTGNLIDARNFFAGDVRVAPGLVVTDCSLLARDDRGELVRDDTLRWTRGEHRRRLSVTLGRPRPRWWPVLAGSPPEPRGAAEALRPRPQDLFRAGVVTPGTFAFAAAGAAGLGASGRAVRRGPRAAQVGAGVVLGLALALVPRPAAAEGLAAVAALALLGLGQTPNAHARALSATSLAPVAAAGLAGATHAPLAAACVGAAFALGAVAPGIGPSSRRTAGAAAATAALLLIRAALA